jgi:hypothetical protein
MATDVEHVLGGVSPHLMVTDPPCGVNYDPAWRNQAGRSAHIGQEVEIYYRWHALAKRCFRTLGLRRQADPSFSHGSDFAALPSAGQCMPPFRADS